MIRLYKTIGSLILVGLIAFIFTYSLADTTATYNKNMSGNEELQNIQRAGEQAQNATQTLKEESEGQNFLVKTLDDITGGIFSKALGVFTNLGSYIQSTTTVIVSSIGLINLPAGTQTVISTLLSLFLTIIVAAILAKMYFRIDI